MAGTPKAGEEKVKEYVHTIDKTGKQFSHPLPENPKELVDLVGKDEAFSCSLQGYRIRCNALDRNEGKEGRRAKMNKVLEALRANPEKAKELGIDSELLD